ALGAAAGRLAALAALTATDAGLGRLGPRRRAQVVDLDRHCDTSSTVTRWRTVRIMPRICGVSSRSTDWRILRSPRESSVARWFCLVPIVLRTWVIFSVATGSPRALRGRGTVAQHLGRGDVLERQAAAGRDLLG